MIGDNVGNLRPIPRPRTDTSGQREKAFATEQFKKFYETGLKPLTVHLLYLGAAPIDAIEIAQETMTKAWQHWPDIAHPKTWTRTVAGRELARRISDLKEHPVAEPPERTPVLSDLADLDAWEQRHDQLNTLASLPPRQGQVMAWFLDGFSPAEIAEELNIPAETVRSSLRHARRSLAIRKRCESEES